MLDFTGEYTSEKFVEKVTDVTGFKWSRTTLALLLQYKVITQFKDVTKNGSQRRRLLFGLLAAIEVILFMLVKSALPFMNRGKSQSDQDVSLGKDTLKYKLLKHAADFIKLVADRSNKQTLIELCENPEINGKIDQYMADHNYLGANDIATNGIIDKRNYAKLKNKFFAVIACYYFFKKWINNEFNEEDNMSDAWNYLSANVIPAASSSVTNVDHHSMLQGCYLLSQNAKEIASDLTTFCHIINSVELADGRKFKYSPAQRDELVAYASFAVRFDNHTHFVSKICLNNLVAAGIEDIKSINANNFHIVAQMVFLTTLIEGAKLEPTWKTRSKFLTKS